MSLRLKKRGEKVLERALVHTPNEDYDEDVDGDIIYSVGGAGLRASGTVKGREREETIEEADEPLTPGPLDGFSRDVGGSGRGGRHMRESAQVDDNDDDD